MSGMRLSRGAWRAGVAAALIAVAGCATPPPSAPAAPSGERQAGVARGIAHLRSGELREATVAFNAAIATAPRDPRLHLLNGLAYHLRFLADGREPPELAETGYLMALKLDPGNVLASHQLGRLYMAMGRPREARERIATALAARPDAAALWLELAGAAYAAGDVSEAAAALAAAEARGVGVDEQYLRTGVLVRAAAGDDAGARALLASLGAAAPLRVALAERIEDWRGAHKTWSPVLAQLPGQVPFVPAPPLSARPREAEPRSGTPVSPDWSECRDAAPPPVSSFGGGAGAGQNDDFALLPALPSPCAGRPMPRMATIEGVLIAYDEQSSSASGINILESLQLVFAGGRSVVESSVFDRLAGATTSSSVTKTVTRSVGLPAAGIAYSLNIANAARQRNEIVSRPSLLVLDRRPSQAFSGVNLSVALAGNAVSGGSIQDKAIGSGLSVTPTFIDEDSMLLAVRISTSNLVSAAGAGFGPGTVATQRSAFTANAMLSFDQTLVLSGMELLESSRDRSGVPLLQDLPLLQYFFSSANGRDRRLSAVILLTPRRVAAEALPAASAAAGAASPWIVEELERHARNLPPQVRATLPRLKGMPLAARVRHGDVRPDAWRFGGGLAELLEQAERFLYY